MRRVDKRVTYLSVLLVAGSGVGYGALRYFGEVEDEFGLAMHPWLPSLQAWHVATAPLFVFALGLIWHHHILAKLKSGARARRRTGLLLLSQSLPMVASGYALQVSVDEDWRFAWVVAHCITSILFVVLFVLHLLSRSRAAAAAAAAAAAS
ncbi:MAG: hypothetical protein AB8H80_16965 [Planctomycetota bacterium]